MGWRKWVLAVALAAATIAPAAASAEGKFGALVFGDYYNFFEDHDSLTATQNGFWIRRVNLTWDEKFDDAFSARLRIETASPGSFLPDNQDIMITYMKDAWLRWKHGNQNVYLGLTQTPSHSFIEEFWGYRYLEKIPGELQGYYGSRDMGLAALGTIGEAKRFGYHVMVGNGSGTRNELDGRKKASGAVRFQLTKALVVEVYGDYEDRAYDTDRMTFRGSLGYKAERVRGAVEYIQQTRDQSNADSYDLQVVSGFAAGQVAEKVWLVGRVDRAMDPGASNPGAPYFPMSSQVASTFVLVGVELKARENIAFTPNVEMAFYDSPDDGAPKPENDILGRVTFMYKY